MAGDEVDRQPNGKLRRERQRRGWSLEDVARKLSHLAAAEGEMGTDRNTVSRWERGVRRPQPRNVRLLCQLFELSPERLGLMEEGQPQRMVTGLGWADQPLSIRVSGDGEVLTVTVNRREFLETMGAGTGAIVFQLHQHGQPVVGFASPVSAADRSILVDAHGQAIAAAWTLFHTTYPTQILATAQAQLILLQQHHHLLDHSGILPGLYSALYRLIGATYQRQGRYHDAIHQHQKAYLAALEGGDAWQMAESRSWQAYGLKTLAQYQDSLQAIDAALRLIDAQTDQRGVRLQARLLATAAETAAMIEGSSEAASCLHAAEALLAELPDLHEEFDRVAWLESVGYCSLHLGRHDAAISSLQQALHDLPSRWTARYLFATTGLAIAYARRRELDAALATARGSLPQLTAVQTPELTQHFVNFLRLELPASFPGDRRCQGFVAEALHALTGDA